MTIQVREYIGVCGVCQRCKHQASTKVPVQALPSAGHWERLHLDLMGPFPTTARDNTYIMTVVDAHSKYLIAVPLQSKSATNVARTLVRDVFFREGFPSSITTDEGSEFVNQLNTDIMNVLGISHRKTAPYHPASNGQGERVHGDINVMLRAFGEPDQSNWDELLPAISFAYNTTSRRTTGFDAFYLNRGRKAHTLLDVHLDLKHEPARPVNEFITEIQKARELAANLEGYARQQSALDASKRQQNSKASAAEILVGSLVLVRFPKAGEGARKLQPLLQGPFRVTSIRDGNTALLESVVNKKDVIERHFSDIVPFRGSTNDEATHEWELERIVDERKEGRKTFYLIRWKGFGSDSDSWIDSRDVRASDILDEWRQNKKPQRPIRSVRKV